MARTSRLNKPVMRTAGKIAYANTTVLVFLFLSFFSVKANREPAPVKPTLSVAKDIHFLKADKTCDFESDSFETESEEDDDTRALPITLAEWPPLNNNIVIGATVSDGSPTRLINSRYLLVTRSLRI